MRISQRPESSYWGGGAHDKSLAIEVGKRDPNVENTPRVACSLFKEVLLGLGE